MGVFGEEGDDIRDTVLAGKCRVHDEGGHHGGE